METEKSLRKKKRYRTAGDIVKWSCSNKPLTADTPLTPVEQQFVQNYIKCGRSTKALQDTGVEYSALCRYTIKGKELLKQPNIQAEIKRIMDEIRDDTIAEAKEVMQYLTSVMRGEVKDQFGLDAPLSERTKAAQELAKRTVDIENRETGKADQTIQVQLDWKR